MREAKLNEIDYYIHREAKQTTVNGVVEIWRNWCFYVTLVNGKVVIIVEKNRTIPIIKERSI